MSITKSEFVQQCIKRLSELKTLRSAGLRFEYDQKILLTCILLDLSNEHCTAASILIIENKHSSALALIRPALEAMLKGTWVFHCVFDKDKIRKLSNSDKKSEWKSIKLMTTEICECTKNTDFDRYKNEVLGLLDSFTHGSRYPIGHRFDNGLIGFKMSDEQMCMIFYELCEICIHANQGLFALCGQQKLAMDMNKELNNLRVDYEGLGLKDDNETKTYEIEFLK